MHLFNALHKTQGTNFNHLTFTLAKLGHSSPNGSNNNRGNVARYYNNNLFNILQSCELNK